MIHWTELIWGFVAGCIFWCVVLFLAVDYLDRICNLFNKLSDFILYPYHKWHAHYRRTHHKLQIYDKVYDEKGRIWCVIDIKCKLGQAYTDKYEMKDPNGLNQMRYCNSVDELLKSKRYKHYTDGLLELQKQMRGKND